MNKLFASLFAGLFFIPIAFAGCGDAAKDSPERFEAACQKACEKFASVGCEKYPVQPGQCASGCLYLEEQLGGICVAEYADVYECSAELEYTCVDGIPNPSDLNAAAKCNDASMALAACVQGMDCKRYCRAASEAGCGGASEDACVADCEAARPADSFCSSDYDRLRECQSENMTCENGKPSSAGCELERADLAECFTDFGTGDPCAAYCFFAIDEGCETGGADACKTSCAAALPQDPSSGGQCSSDFEALRGCVGKDLSCQGGEPVLAQGSTCSYEQKSAAGCLVYDRPCLAVCWLAEAQGCGAGDVEGCAASCEAELAQAPSCQSDLQSWKQCVIDNDIACSPGNTSCQSYQDAYQTCLANGG